jgi:hypothetical protein
MQAIIPHASGSAAYASYSGAPHALKFREWAEGLIPSRFIRLVSSNQELKRFFGRCGSQDAGKKSEGSASWRLCVIIAADESNPSAVYRSLSSEYRGKVGPLMQSCITIPVTRMPCA